MYTNSNPETQKWTQARIINIWCSLSSRKPHNIQIFQIAARTFYNMAIDVSPSHCCGVTVSSQITFNYMYTCSIHLNLLNSSIDKNTRFLHIYENKINYKKNFCIDNAPLILFLMIELRWNINAILYHTQDFLLGLCYQLLILERMYWRLLVEPCIPNLTQLFK